MSTNFHYPSDNDPSNQEQDYYYSRHHNPNFTDLEEALCAMHDGYKAVSFASGMGGSLVE
jgi:cystathionine beta-lyase/cystathionine gamma-synthase